MIVDPEYLKCRQFYIFLFLMSIVSSYRFFSPDSFAFSSSVGFDSCVTSSYTLGHLQPRLERASLIARES